jgi:hypothetical protein
MTIKFISLATGIVFLDVYLQSQLYSNDPLFLFASNNPFVNAGLLVIVALMVAVSFKDRFQKWWTYLGCAALAAVFGSLGVLGLLFGNISYSFPQVLLPMDYMFLTEAAIVFGIACLSYRHQEVPARMRLPNPVAIISKFVLPVPKIPQSPNSRSRRTQTA